MSGLTLAGSMAGTVLFAGLPVLLLTFSIIAAWVGRRQELTPQVVQASVWITAMGLVSLALYFLSGIYHLLSLAWASVVLLLLAAVLCGRLLREASARPLKIVAWLLLCDLFLVAGYASFSIWIAGEALNSSGDSNPDESAVRAALTRNPNDAAAHSSFAHIEQMRHDMVGAMAEWRQVLRVEPNNTDALLVVGTELSQAGKVNEARPFFQRLAANDGAYSELARLWLEKHGKR